MDRLVEILVWETGSLTPDRIIPYRIIPFATNQRVISIDNYIRLVKFAFVIRGDTITTGKIRYD